MKSKISLFLLVLTATLRANELGRENYVSRIHSSGKEIFKKGLFDHVDILSTSPRVETVTENEGDSLSPFLQLVCTAGETIPSIAIQEDLSHFSPSWLPLPLEYPDGHPGLGHSKVGGLHGQRKGRPLSHSNPANNANPSSHLKVVVQSNFLKSTTPSTPSSNVWHSNSPKDVRPSYPKALTPSYPPKVAIPPIPPKAAATLPAPTLRVLELRIHTSQYDDEHPSQTDPPLSRTLESQPLPATPRTTISQQPSSPRTDVAGSSRPVDWNVGSKMNDGHDGLEEKWFRDANIPSILEVKLKSVWKRDDKVWKSGEERKDPGELEATKDEETTGRPISMENKLERKMVEPKPEGESEMEETTDKEQNSAAFQSLDPGIGGDSGDSEAGLNRGDSRDPAWGVHRIHPALRYVISGDKLLVYTKGDLTLNPTAVQGSDAQTSPSSINPSFYATVATKSQPDSLDSLSSASHPRTSRIPPTLLMPTSSSSFVRLSSAPLSLSLLPPPLAVSDPAPPSTRPFSQTASASYASSAPTSPTTILKSSLNWSNFPASFHLQYRGSSVRPLHAGTPLRESSLASSVSLTYTLDRSSISSLTKRQTEKSSPETHGPSDISGGPLVLSSNPLQVLIKPLSPSEHSTTPSSSPTSANEHSIASEEPPTAPPAPDMPSLVGEEALAVLSCSSGSSETTVYVMEECKHRIGQQLPRDAMVLCLTDPMQHELSLQQPVARPKHDWHSQPLRVVPLSEKAGVPQSTTDTTVSNPGTQQQSRRNSSRNVTEKPTEPSETENGVQDGDHGSLHQASDVTGKRELSDTLATENIKAVTDIPIGDLEGLLIEGEDEGDEEDGKLEKDYVQEPIEDSVSKSDNQQGNLEKDVKAERLKRPSRDLGLTHYQRPDSAPQLRYTPIEQTVSPGSPVSLKCSAQGSPTPVITWTRDHQPLITSIRTSVGSFRTALGEVVSHVNLSDVTVRDGGTYTCTAHNALGSSSHSARLNVYGPPFVRSMSNVTAVSGDDVRLWCPAGGFPTPTITWRRDGQAIPSSIRQEILSNGTLVVRNAGQADVGRYTCVVSGRQGSQTATAHTYLHVLKPPEIEPFSFGRDMEEGTRTQLSCAVKKGDLPMTINWLKDGRHLQHDPDVESKQISEFSTVLLFKSLREHHSGSYTCEAANAAATVNHTTTVRVKVAPKWVVEPSSGTALVGSTVILDCSARGYPQPVLTWLKASGETAQDFQQVVLDGVHSSQAPNGSLVIMETATGDAGWFLCSATNSVGKPISKVVQLTVHAPARVVTEGGRVTGHAGQTVTVPCEAQGDSPLTLTWLRHHTPVTTSHRVSIRETGVGSMVRAVLEIREVTAADAGAYTCRADNPHGHNVQVFTIAVIEPPTAPSGVTINEVTSRSALISWTLPQPAAVTIQYRAAEDKSWATHGRNVSVGQWASSHVLSGLTPYQAYAVRLMAHNDLGVSQPSHMKIFTTLEEAPSGAPRDVQVASGGPRSLLVKWRSPSPHLLHGPLRGFTLALRRQNLQGHLTFITRPASVAAESSKSEQYEVLGLSPASLYEVAVRAFTRAGAGPLSSPRIVHATGHDAPSCSPTGVSCRGSGRGGVRVWWSPPPVHCANAPVSGYTILVTPTTHLTSTSSSSKWEVNTTNLEKNLDGLPSATNISVRVKAFNDVGASPPNNPVFCVTEDDVPGPPGRVRVVVTGASRLLVTWLPPQPPTGSILHYTLYSARDDQVAVRDVVGAGGSDATWRELTGLVSGTRVQVWVTATTVAGEGNPSPRLTAVPSATPKYSPIAVGGGLMWRVGSGAGVTLGCRGLGMPPPTISWTKGSSFIVNNGQFTQLLPGGDLHLTGIRESSNFTCWVKNTMGMDSLTHQVIIITTPMPPTLTLSLATHDSLNLSITPADDGGAPILGYTLHHRGRAGEWVETNAEPGAVDVVLRGLACGAPHHLYVTAWNSHGTSSPSPVLVTNTQGKPPGRPDPARLVEVNATCVILRLYAWPEVGCPITHWKVELGKENEMGAWHPLHAHISRASTDLGLCDLSATSWHLLRVTAASTAGDTVAVYKVATGDYNGGSVSAESVQEVVVGGAMGVDGWLDAHVVAGVVSAILLATALIICICVIVRRRKYGGYRQGESLDNKDGGEDDNARNCEITRSHLYSPTPTKKPRGSLASVKTQDDTSDPYEICPYATFSVDSSEGTLEYGLSLHAMTPRDCLDHPVHSDRHVLEAPAYGHTSRQRSQSHYKETEIAYISNRGRAEYASRPKSISGTQPTPAPTPTPITAASAEQRAWAEDSRKDTRGRPHRSRSRTRTESTQRDSSTESNDASSPVQQRQHYQHPQITQHHHHQQHQQIPPPQQQQQQPQQHLPPQHPQQVAAGRGRPHPLPPVRLAR